MSSRWIARLVAATMVVGEVQAQTASTSSPSMRRDPFQRASPVLDTEGPLQRTPLDQLELAAVLVGGALAPRALLQDIAGTGYIVTIGARVGAAGGVVQAIERGQVIVEEPRAHATRRVVLQLFDVDPPSAGRASTP